MKKFISLEHVVFDAHTVLFVPDYKKIGYLLWNMPYKILGILHLLNPFCSARLTRLMCQEGMGHASFNKFVTLYPFFKRYEEIIVHIASAQLPVEKTFSIVKQLKQQYRVHIFSNMNDATLYQLKKLYLCYLALFDTIHCFGPSTLWRQKPDDLAYQQLLVSLKASVTDVLFIDNSRRNVRTAQKLGMHTLHYKNALKLSNDIQMYITI